MRLFIGLSILVAALAAVAPGTVFAESPPADATLEALLVEMADTPEEHQAVARYYRARASSAREMADHHRSMSRHYSGVKLAQRRRMQEHCDKIASAYEKLGQEYEKLAESHEAEAIR